MSKKKYYESDSFGTRENKICFSDNPEQKEFVKSELIRVRNDFYNLPKEKIYYYKNKFYIQINNNITKKDYYKLLELSEVIYNDTQLILDKGIKI